MVNKNCYGIITRPELMSEDWNQFLITHHNCRNRMGEISVELPINAYQMPYDGGSPYSMFTWSNASGVEETFFIDRIDGTIDDTLSIACVNSRKNEICRTCAQENYIINLLKPAIGEIVLARSSFPLHAGSVHYLTCAPTAQFIAENGLHYRAYQAVYFISEIGNGPAIKIHHGLASQGYFCTKMYESQKLPYLSKGINKMLQTVKRESN